MFSGRVTWRRLWWVGLLAILASWVSNMILRLIGLAVFAISPRFVPMSIFPVTFWTVVTGIGATVVFYLVARFSRSPVPLFIIIAFIVYFLTFYPDYLILSNPISPGTTFYAVGTLLTMHIVEACITVCVLIMLGFERKRTPKQTNAQKSEE
jgi:hypothetical protein